jgi:hypothetical protein
MLPGFNPKKNDAREKSIHSTNMVQMQSQTCHCNNTSSKWENWEVFARYKTMVFPAFPDPIWLDYNRTSSPLHGDLR